MLAIGIQPNSLYMCTVTQVLRPSDQGKRVTENPFSSAVPLLAIPSCPLGPRNRIPPLGLGFHPHC